jgi:hypothetical protein
MPRYVIILPHQDLLHFVSTMLRPLVGILSFAPLTVAISAENDQAAGSRSMEQTTHLRDFQVIELRRYTTKEGEREHFAKYFESYFCSPTARVPNAYELCCLSRRHPSVTVLFL